MDTPLGAFTLLGPLARGGMASVYRARHTRYGVDVAVKVLTSDAWRDPDLAEALQDEVGAVAGLWHPNIIWVHDAGVVAVDEAAAAGGALLAGSPWYAMDLLPGGTLGHRARRLRSFEPVRDLLSDLLDALAHAHSRGVLHRDLKPGNVLFTASGTLQLADFGMALLMAGNRAAMEGGTPSWVAPEQIRAAPWDQGPWTDLYAVGCLAWALVCGRRPYRGRADAVLSQHLEAAIPELEPRFGVPPGLDAWIQRMMAKAPEHRFRRAAHAAWALDELPRTYEGAAPGGTTVRVDLGEDSEPTVRLASSSPAPEAKRALDRPIEVPTSWTGPALGPPPVRLQGVGLGLYGLRSIPVVGRRAERDALWSALREAAETRSPRVVVLRGPAGFGKSRLALWLSRRAHELGVAECFVATHNPQGSPHDGLSGLVARACRTEGLAPGELFPHLLRLVRAEGSDEPEEDAAALRQLVCPVLPADAPDEVVVRFGSDAEVHRAVLRRVQQQRGARVGLVWLDDVQWGVEALALAPWVLGRAAAGPILLVLTVRDEALAERPEADAALAGLPESVRILRVGPLEPRDRPRLLQHLLQLAPDVRTEVERRTAGNALFATQLVGDWVQRGLLEPGPEGFALRPGASLPLPVPLARAWTERLERLLAGGPGSWREALELAAVLGQDVDAAEWEELRTLAGTPRPEGLLSRLVSARLAVRRRGAKGRGWSFVHGMLQEAVLQAAQEGGRTALLHSRVVELLASAGPEAAGRRARHLEAAGRFDEAIDAWGEARTYLHNRDYHRAGHALERIRALLDEHADALDARWAPLVWDRFRRAMRRGQVDEARAILDQQRARGGPRTDVCEALAGSVLAEVDGRSADMIAGAERAVACAGDDAFWRCHALDCLAYALSSRGRVLEAAEAHLAAVELRPETSRFVLAVESLCAARGIGEAERLCAQLQRRAARIGTPGDLDAARAASAALALVKGDLAAAAEGYRDALALSRRYGFPEKAHALNLVIILLLMGRAEEADAVLSPMLEGLAEHWSYYRWIGSVLDLAIAAHLGTWERFDAAAPEGTPYVEDNIGAVLLGAGDRARDAGFDARARRAWALAGVATEGLDGPIAQQTAQRLAGPCEGEV